MPLNKEAREKLSADQFAVPGKRELPIPDKRHVKLAWDMVDRTKGLTDKEREEARTRILTAAKKFGIDTTDWEKAATDDVVTAPYTILDSQEEGVDKPLRVRLRMTRANVVNDNNRLYPTDVLQDAIERMKNTYIAQGRAIGESPHPKAMRGANGKLVFDTQTSNSVWKHLDVFMDADGWVYTDVEILRTAKGKDIEALIRQGVPVGDSMRAIGRWTPRQIDGRNVQVATHLDIPASDCVMNEATAGSQLVSVLTDSLLPITDSKLSDIMAAGPPTEEGETQMPLQFAVLGVGEPITDSIKFTDKPIDPETGEELQPQDPDGDGDIDFYTNSKNEVFTRERNIRHETHAHHYLRKMAPIVDGDNYSLARQFQRDQQTKPATDSHQTKGDDPMPTIEDLVNSQEFKNAVAAAAAQIAKPALDAVQAQEQEKTRAAAKQEADLHIKERMNGMKGKLSDKAITAISDSVIGKAETKEQADVILDTAIDLFSKAGAQNALNGLGFTGTGNQATAVHVEVTHEPKPWQTVVDSLVKSFDEYGRELGHEPDMALRKLNKPIIDKIVAKFEKDTTYQQMTDSAAFMDSVQSGTIADSVSITTSQLLNQPTILEAVIVQAFQDVESSQFMMIETFDGTEWRIPVETFNGVENGNAATGLLDIIVPEATGIPEASTSLSWLYYTPSWRRNAFSLTEDALRGLLTGPAKYPAVARAIYHLGYEKRRKLDLAAYWEMIVASDEYNPNVIASETAASANLKAVSNGSNVSFSYQLQAAGGSTFPVVRPRTKTEISGNNQVITVTSNQFTVTVTGTPQVAGWLDANGNVTNATSFNNNTNTATYAVDYENGVVYFNAASGVSTTSLPTFAYSASTNYDTWHYTIPTGESADQYYNTLLQQITRTTALMGSSPRFKKPNMAIMSLNSSAYIENAAMWYRLNSPEGSEFTPVTDNNFGKRSGVNFNRINAPWVAGDGRILLSQKGSTRYGIQTPYIMEGPFQKYDPSTGNVIDAKAWIGKENSVLCTPQVTTAAGSIINPVSRTIRIQA